MNSLAARAKRRAEREEGGGEEHGDEDSKYKKVRVQPDCSLDNLEDTGGNKEARRDRPLRRQCVPPEGILHHTTTGSSLN